MTDIVLHGDTVCVQLFDTNTTLSQMFADAAAASAAASANDADDAETTLSLVQALALASGIYPDTTAGLAATAEGGYFFTLPDQTFWREVSGVAVKQSVLLADNQVDRLFATTADITTATGISGNRIRTLGFAARADGGGATYDRWAAPMAAIPSGGEGIWWFEDADGARWRIAEAPAHFAGQFGALGGSGIDARPILNEAFLAPTVREINLGPLRHYISLPGLRPASGKNLSGINRKVSWLQVIPVVVETFGQNFAVGRINDEGGVCRDYSIEGMRSHFGIGTHGQPHGHVIYAKDGGVCRGTRVLRVDVHNIYGYAHYTTTTVPGDGLFTDDTQRIDCRAYNFNVGFEQTGAVKNHKNINCYAEAAPQDGGVLLTAECLFHEYGNIQSVTNQNCVGRGTAQSGILIFNTDGEDIETIEYIDCDIDGTFDFGLYVEARNAVGTTDPGDGALNEIKNIQIHGGRIRSTALGGMVSGSVVKVYGTEIVGLDGEGVEVRPGSDVEVHGPKIESNRDPGGATAAIGVAINGTPQIKWYGSGAIRAIGPAGSAPADLSKIDFYGTPQFFPTRGQIDQVITDTYFRIPRASWSVETSGVSFFTNIDLSALNGGAGVFDVNKCVVACNLLVFPTVAVEDDFICTFSTFWIGTDTLRIYITTTNAMTGSVLSVRLTEFA